MKVAGGCSIIYIAYTYSSCRSPKMSIRSWTIFTPENKIRNIL